jgi:type I restriction enzyme R subunit
MPSFFTESTVEEATLSWFNGLGYSVLNGPDIAPGEPRTERTNFGDVALANRLKEALSRLNPKIPSEALEEALRKVLMSEHPSLVQNNHRMHRFMVDGVPVEYMSNGRTIHDQAILIDFSQSENNDWVCANQFAVVENKHSRRPDVVIFLNGLPLAVIELKNPGDENATVKDAFNQFETYKDQIPTLFNYNALLVISDGIAAKAGTVTSSWERFMPWRTIDGLSLASKELPQLEVLIKGAFDKSRFLDLIRHFIVFENDGVEVLKKVAGYHQFHAVQKAVEATILAKKGDRRIGIIWHTQGSGKSLTMAFYAGKVIQHPIMENPTIVLLTDRNDLDDQLFETFSGAAELLRQTPVQADSRRKIRDLLKVASGGVIFTTIQKFLPEEKGDTFPLLSDRSNIVVIADEAHRSQYDFVDGFAKHLRDALPKALFIGFTATPIEHADRSTPAVFGEYIDTYDIHQSIEDGATVPIYYEARLAKLSLNEEERPNIDPEFADITEGEEESVRQKLRTKWAKQEALVGASNRTQQVAKDIVEHFEKRREVLFGKGLIVCMSRRICVDLYKEIIKLRPAWHSEDDDEGFLKVVMTGSASDPVAWQGHIRDKGRRRELGNKFKDPNHPIKLVIVRDMWLTGFDVPCLHTMYVDKPMRGHGLMQAIARVNRVFSDKPGGLVVDYLGIAHELKKALAEYSEHDRDDAGVPQEEAVAALYGKYEVLKAMFHKFDYSAFFKGKSVERVRVLPAAMEHILALTEVKDGKEARNGKERFLKAVSGLSQAFALSVPNEKALAIRHEIEFFQTLRAAFVKSTETPGKSKEDLDAAIQQIISKAVASEGVVDILDAAGLKRPDISILSDQFLAEIQGMPHKNLAAEVLYRLLNDQIKILSKKFLVQAKSFSEKLDDCIREYHNRAIEAVQVIEELIKLAKEIKEGQRRGEKLGLTDDELAFYDALETNDSAVKVLGDETLRTIARELLETVRKNTSIDWSVRESVRAKLRVMVKKILRKHGYPPDKQERAAQLILEQAELICEEFAV